MYALDWTLVGGSLLIVLAIGFYTQRYVKSVADFLSAGRLARRYLLAVGKGEMSSGAVVFVSSFEVMSHSGFALGWWTWLTGPITLLFGIAGFVAYRYRETRSMTLGQFFEIRYSKRFRLFTGGIGFFAGLLNFGIIPAIGSRAMVVFLGLPFEVHFGGMTVPTHILLMGLFLLINVIITTGGGMLTIIMTNCAEGILSQILYLVIIFGLLKMFSWHDINQVLTSQPKGQSFLNPMDTGSQHDFNIWYVAMGTLLGIYGTMAWQNQSAYNSAPLNAHESRMGGLLGAIRGMGKAAVITLLGICALTYLHHPAYADGAAQVHAEVAKIGNPQIQEQMVMPVAVTHLLPVGLRGALCAVLLLGVFGGDPSALHSWGSLFIQDLVLPIRKKPLTPAQHILLLRCSIAGVALFAFVFGALFNQTEYIQMWFAVTQSLYIGGAGAVIIGGLYWRKGTTAAAWAAMITGTLLSVSGIVVRQFYGAGFPLNGLEIAFVSMLCAVALYATVSLMTCREDFDLDRMLHRGAYAKIQAEVGDQAVPAGKLTSSWGKILGYDDNFTLGDKWIAGGLFGWSMLLCLIMIVGTAWNLIAPWPVEVWSAFWHVIAVFIPVFFAVLVGVWFTWGGIRDSLSLFRSLRSASVNPLDNGTVIDHQNLDESVLADGISPVKK